MAKSLAALCVEEVHRRRETRPLQVSLTISLKGLILYTFGVLFHAEWDIRQLWSSLIISCNITTIVHDQYTNIYSQHTYLYSIMQHALAALGAARSDRNAARAVIQSIVQQKRAAAKGISTEVLRALAAVQGPSSRLGSVLCGYVRAQRREQQRSRRALELQQRQEGSGQNSHTHDNIQNGLSHTGDSNVNVNVNGNGNGNVIASSSAGGAAGTTGATGAAIPVPKRKPGWAYVPVIEGDAGAGGSDYFGAGVNVSTTRKQAQMATKMATAAAQAALPTGAAMKAALAAAQAEQRRNQLERERLQIEQGVAAVGSQAARVVGT